MLETHPFAPFVPPHSKYLILGSFTGKSTPNYDWFYSTPRNQFWPILRAVYHQPLNSISEKQQLFSRLELAITDIIFQCRRRQDSNLDNNLVDIVYNFPAVSKIFSTNPLRQIFFTSKFVESEFKKHFSQLFVSFPHLSYSTLPSPSPRYAQMTLSHKIRLYTQLLPNLPT
jgi:hypoxanthine-DNA glycosylase